MEAKARKSEQCKKDNEMLKKQVSNSNEQLKLAKDINKDLKATVDELKAELKKNSTCTFDVAMTIPDYLLESKRRKLES